MFTLPGIHELSPKFGPCSASPEKGDRIQWGVTFRSSHAATMLYELTNCWSVGAVIRHPLTDGYFHLLFLKLGIILHPCS